MRGDVALVRDVGRELLQRDRSPQLLHVSRNRVALKRSWREFHDERSSLPRPESRRDRGAWHGSGMRFVVVRLERQVIGAGHRGRFDELAERESERGVHLGLAAAQETGPSLDV